MKRKNTPQFDKEKKVTLSLPLAWARSFFFLSWSHYCCMHVIYLHSATTLDDT